jgi:hypothetical protein
MVCSWMSVAIKDPFKIDSREIFAGKSSKILIPGITARSNQVTSHFFSLLKR